MNSIIKHTIISTLANAFRPRKSVARLLFLGSIALTMDAYGIRLLPDLDPALNSNLPKGEAIENGFEYTFTPKKPLHLDGKVDVTFTGILRTEFNANRFKVTLTGPNNTPGKIRNNGLRSYSTE
jgi:hypothetical protein